MNSDKQLFCWIVLPPQGSVGKQTNQLRRHENLQSVYHAFFRKGGLACSLLCQEGKKKMTLPIHCTLVGSDHA